MTGSAVLVVGEALVDVVRRADGSIDESPGGSPANVALALGRLGHAPTLVTRLGEDERGDRVRAWLGESHVDVVAAAAPRTATATASLDASGSATYEFDLDWALPDVVAGVPASASVVHTGSIAALLEPGAADVARLVRSLRETALVTYDPNVRPALLPDRRDARARVEAFVALADVVKASDEDLAWLHSGTDAVEVAAAWLDLGAAVVIVTLGDGGAAAVTRTGIVRVASVPVEVADTVGAGDTFMAAVIDGLFGLGRIDAGARSALRQIGSRDLLRLLEYAARAAAITVSRPGADPPWRRELDVGGAGP